MAGIILILLIVVLLIVIAMSKNKKKTSLVALGILVSYHLYVSYKCGPNKKDVSVMKPMAEAISNYIVKNGIPKSLKDIPDLPYELEGCKYVEINVEQCFFKQKNKKYQTEMYLIAKSGVDISIRNNNIETGLRNSLKNKNNQWFILKSNIAYSGNTSGICNPMRQ